MTDTPQTERKLPQLSLKGLFAVVTMAALVLAPYYWFGGLYLYSLVCSLLFIYFCTRRYREGEVGVLTALAFALIGILLAGIGIATITLFVQVMLTAALCIPLASSKVRPRTFVIALVALTAAIYGVAFGYGIASMHKMRALRAQYPVTSLEPRLAFERDNDSESTRLVTPAVLSSAVSKHLDEQDFTQEFGNSSRARALSSLHNGAYLQFALAAGFGTARMPSIGMGRVNLDPTEEFKLPARVATDDQLTLPEQFQNTHEVAVGDFISPERLGYVESRNAVVGFEPHGFTSLNKRWQDVDGHARYWQVVRLELVGVLRNRQPCVYTAKTIPEMDKLGSVPHRELNQFEKAALPKLQSQKDIVIEQQPDRIEMLGALRAGTTCLECHQGERGKLLGAFSYTLVPLAKSATSASAEPTAN